MSGRESGREAHSAETTNPDALEVVAGFQHQKLEGWVPDLATPEETLAALEQAFDYRGDVSITRKDGSGRVAVSYADIAAMAFTGRDMAAGKSWENWVRQYWEKKASGAKDISLQPEELE